MGLANEKAEFIQADIGAQAHDVNVTIYISM
jgi:hypothetical protein